MDGEFVGTEETVVRFTLGGLLFEYDPDKNRKNIEKHPYLFPIAQCPQYFSDFPPLLPIKYSSPVLWCKYYMILAIPFRVR